MIRTSLVPKQIIGFALFTFFIVTAMQFQTTVWFSFFGYFPSPCLWMPFFVYFTMNRQFPYDWGWLAYFYLLVLAHSSAAPFALFLTMSTVLIAIQFLRSRFSTLSTFDTVVFSAATLLGFPLIYFLFSLYGNPHATLDWIGWLGSLILSVPFLPALILLCKKTDTFFKSDVHNESLVLDL